MRQRRRSRRPEVEGSILALQGGDNHFATWDCACAAARTRRSDPQDRSRKSAAISQARLLAKIAPGRAHGRRQAKSLYRGIVTPFPPWGAAERSARCNGGKETNARLIVSVKSDTAL